MKNTRHIPVWLIVCTGLLFMFLILFVRPVFLNSQQVMSFPRYIPATNPIGLDLRCTLTHSAEWVKRGAYGDGNLYPPLATVLVCPLLALSIPQAYFLVTLATIVAFLSVVLALPLTSCEKPDTTALVALTVAGLLSYGFQFELEKGQFNVLAMACCAWAIYLFHVGHGKWLRLGAYLLFTISIQLKLYPAIFVLAFTRDARDWKGNLLRWGALGAANIGLLFVLGPSVFHEFLDAITGQIAGPFVWVGNHSIRSFVTLLATTSLRPWAFAMGLGFVMLLAACFVSILALAYVRNDRSSVKFLLVICGIAAMLIPSLSHDYKLPILSMAFAIYIGETGPIAVHRFSGILMTLLLLALSLLYAWTLFSYIFKPYLLQNAFPCLLAACVVLALMMLTEGGQRRESLRAGEAMPKSLPSAGVI